MEDIDDPKKLQGATKIGVKLDYVRIEFVMKWGHVNTWVVLYGVGETVVEGVVFIMLVKLVITWEHSR